MRYYIYRHIRLDTNNPFYIGYGKKKSVKNFTCFETEYKRAFSKENRNLHWKRIVSLTNYDTDILYKSDSFEEIMAKEIEFIALYGREDLQRGSLVNLTDGGDGTKGAKMPQSHKDKAYKRILENHKNGVFDSQKIPVYQYDLDGNFIKKWPSITSAELYFKRPKKSRMIGQAAHGEIKKAYNYVWSFSKIENFPKSFHRKDRLPIFKFDKKGNFIKKWDTVYHLLDEFPEYSLEAIQANLYGMNKSAYGFQWSFKDEMGQRKPANRKNSKKVYQYNKEGILLNTYDSPSLAAQSFGKENCYANIISNLGNKNKTAYNYIWSYQNTSNNKEGD